jgi:hypothetical protein
MPPSFCPLNSAADAGLLCSGFAGGLADPARRFLQCHFSALAEADAAPLGTEMLVDCSAAAGGAC